MKLIFSFCFFITRMCVVVDTSLGAPFFSNLYSVSKYQNSRILQQSARRPIPRTKSTTARQAIAGSCPWPPNVAPPSCGTETQLRGWRGLLLVYSECLLGVDDAWCAGVSTGSCQVCIGCFEERAVSRSAVGCKALRVPVGKTIYTCRRLRTRPCHHTICRDCIQVLLGAIFSISFLKS